MGIPIEGEPAQPPPHAEAAAELPEPSVGEEDDDDVAMQSTCLHCGRLGETRLQSRQLPGFQEDLMVMAFRCLLCGFRNDEVQFAGQCAPHGVLFTLHVPAGSADGLARQILKSETAALSIPEMEFEIPGHLVDCTLLTRGDLTTVGELLHSTVANLRLNQAERAPEVAEKIEECIQELLRCASGEQGFSVVMDDPTGNSYISGPLAEEGGDAAAWAEGGAAGQAGGSRLEVQHYERSEEQQIGLGLAPAAPAEEELEEA